MLAAICSILLAAAQPTDQEAFDKAVADSMCWIVFDEPDKELPPFTGVLIEPGVVLTRGSLFEVYEHATVQFSCCQPTPILGIIANDSESTLSLIAVESGQTPVYPGPIGGEPLQQGDLVRVASRYNNRATPDWQTTFVRTTVMDVRENIIGDMRAILKLRDDDERAESLVIADGNRLVAWCPQSSGISSPDAAFLQSIIQSDRHDPIPLNEYTARERTPLDEAIRFLVLGYVASLQPAEPELTIQYSKRALELEPRTATAWHNLATTYLIQGKIDLAEDAVNHMLELEPDNATAVMMLAIILSAQGHEIESIEMFQRVIDMRPDHPRSYIMKARLLVCAEGSNEALVHFDRALDYDPDNTEAMRGIASVYIKDDLYDEALEIIEIALDIDPSDAETLVLKGQVLHALERFEEAIDTLRVAHDANPQSVSITLNLAELLGLAGNYDEALELFNEVTEQHPEWASVWYRCGDLRIRAANDQESYARALDDLDRAFELGSDAEDLHLLRTIALARLDRLDEAMESFELIPPEQQEAEYGSKLREWLEHAVANTPD